MGALLPPCSSASDDGATTAPVSDGAFPVTIVNMFGDTTIESRPERLVTLGWNAQDVVYALGAEMNG